MTTLQLLAPRWLSCDYSLDMASTKSQKTTHRILQQVVEGLRFSHDAYLNEWRTLALKSGVFRGIEKRKTVLMRTQVQYVLHSTWEISQNT